MADSPRQLKRELGVFGATLLGLGSILGTGVFVSLGIAAGIAGPAVLIAVVLAGFVALCNALSSAQLAAAHPVAGGTYEYGYKYLHPLAGFTAGWMFMVAKSASAATAALAVAEYGFRFVFTAIIPGGTAPPPSAVQIALVMLAVMTIIVLAGVRRATWANTLLIVIVVIVLGGFVAMACRRVAPEFESFDWLLQSPTSDSSGEWMRNLMYATAMMFVAYTGYGRVATLGEEVHHPGRTIPRAILATLAVSIVLYVVVGFAALALFYVIGEGRFNPSLIGRYEPYLVQLMPHPSGSEVFGVSWITVGAIAAMGGVLLNLILGLSRVLLAMGRRRDVPHGLSKLNKKGTTPTASVLVVGVIIGALVLIGDVKATWSLSAFTVLIYYGITNLAALRLPPEHRRYPRVFSWIGLAACALLALSVDGRSMLIGGGILLVGFVWYAIARAIRGDAPE